MDYESYCRIRRSGLTLTALGNRQEGYIAVSVGGPAIFLTAKDAAKLADSLQRFVAQIAFADMVALELNQE